MVVMYCIIIVCLFLHGEGQKMRKEHHLTVGQIIKCDNGGRGNFGPGINYRFNVGAAFVYGSRLHGGLKYNIHVLENHSFPVVYQKHWFGYIDVILITPNDFAYYGYSFPDSLKWVIKYMKKD